MNLVVHRDRRARMVHGNRRAWFQLSAARIARLERLLQAAHFDSLADVYPARVFDGGSTRRERPNASSR